MKKRTIIAILPFLIISCSKNDDVTVQDDFCNEEAIYQRQFSLYNEKNQENIRNIVQITKGENSNFTNLIDVALFLDEEKMQTLKEYTNYTEETLEKYEDLKWEVINRTIDIIGADAFTEYYYYFLDGSYDRDRIKLYTTIQDKDKLLKKLYIYTAAKFDAVMPIFIKGQTRMSKSECCIRRLCEAMGKDMFIDVLIDALSFVFDVTAADFIAVGIDFAEAIEMADAYNACMWRSSICNSI